MTEAQINIKIDNKSGQKTVDELNSSLKETTNQSKSLKSQLREMTNALNQLEPGTAEFQKMAVEAGKLRDQIKDTQAVINATAGSVGENLGNAFGKIAGVGINAFQGIMGVQAMFGSDSKELMEIMAKLQGAMAVSQAIAGFGQLGDTIVEVKAAVIAAATSMGLLKTTTVATTVATEGATVAQEGLNVAMKSNPIGLIITALAAVVTAILLFSDTTDDATEKQKALNEELQKERDEINKNITQWQKLNAQKKGGLDDIERELALMKAKGASDKEIYDQEKKLINERLAQLQYARAYRGYLTSEEVKEFRDLQNQKKILDAEYTRTVKENAKKRQEAKDKEAENERQKLIQVQKSYKDLINNIDVTRQQLLNTYFSQSGNELIKLRTEYDNNIQKLKEFKGTNEELIKTFPQFKEQLKGTTATVEENSKNLEKIINDIFINNKTILEETIKAEDNIITTQENILIAQANSIKTTGAESIYWQQEIFNQKIQLIKDEELIERQKLNFQTQIAQQGVRMSTLSAEEKAKEITRIEVSTKKKLKLLKDQEDEKIRAIEKERYDYIDSLEVEQYKKRSERINDWISKNQELINAIANMAMQAQDLVGQYFDELNARTEYTIQQSYDNQLAAYEKLNENKKISDEQLAERQAELEQTYNAQKRGLAQKQFRQDKALNIVQATIQGVQATLAAFTQGMKLGGPIGAGIFAGISAAFVAAQIGIIASQKFRFSKGGIVQGEGSKNIDSVPGMLAPGETVINSTSSGLFPELLSAINMIGGGLGLTPDSKVNNVASSQTPMLFQQQMNMSPVRAYVVESDITQTQRRISRFERNNKY